MTSRPLYIPFAASAITTAAKVLDIDEFNISPGSILGLSGPNGSGKTTFKAAGLCHSPSQGEIRFNGRREISHVRKGEIRVTFDDSDPLSAQTLRSLIMCLRP
ncbi:MAG: ATP-binding cassette domain-containing protein [Desulfobacterales bacterium]